MPGAISPAVLFLFHSHVEKCQQPKGQAEYTNSQKLDAVSVSLLVSFFYIRVHSVDYLLFVAQENPGNICCDAQEIQVKHAWWHWQKKECLRGPTVFHASKVNFGSVCNIQDNWRKDVERYTYTVSLYVFYVHCQFEMYPTPSMHGTSRVPLPRPLEQKIQKAICRHNWDTMQRNS